MTPRNRLLLSAVAVAGLGVIVVSVIVSRSGGGGPGTPGSSGADPGPGISRVPPEAQQKASAVGSTVAGLPEPPKVVALKPPSDKLEAAFWVDVLEPKATHQALMGNAWVNQTAGMPVGRGFLGPWAVFFGTRGQDVGARFDGMVLNLFTSALMADPYRVVWLSGEKSARAPVVVVPEASGGALSALDMLLGAASKGGFSPQGCPGDASASPETPEGNEESTGEEAEAPKKDAPPPTPAAGLATIHRLVLADHALYAAKVDKRLVFSMRPDAVLHGMCLKPFQLANGGNAVEVGVSVSQNGRALQGLAALLGLQGEAKLALGVEGDGFVPRGILAGPARPGRLAAGALDESMLKLVPEPTGLFVALNVALPETLDAASLGAAFSGKAAPGRTVKRQVVVLWNPRGDFTLPSEVAVIWSRAEDEPALDSILSKTHPLLRQKLCGHLVLASTEQVMKEMAASCSGSAPSVLSAAPAVAKGLREPTSLGVHVNLGEVLAQLALDGWVTEPRPLPPERAKPEKVAPPPEIDAARKQLQALPALHWRAVVDEKGQMTPGGFRS